jgi:acid phosphatase
VYFFCFLKRYDYTKGMPMFRSQMRATTLGLLLILLLLLLIAIGPGLFMRDRPAAIQAASAPTEFSTFLPFTSVSPESTAGVPHFSHIFQIIMENKAYNSVIGNSSAPYINSLAQQYGLATNYYAIRHPSLPNYVALIGGSTFGITNDCTSCFIDAPNLVDQLESAGKSWHAYMEDMPSACFVGDQGQYRQKHNPFIYFNNIRQNPARCNKIVPFGQFAQDLATNNLPNYVWITPDMCNDTHDCPTATGDAWLHTWVPQILASPAWQQNGVLFITYDESASRDSSGCCQGAVGGHVMTLVLSPLGKPAYQATTAYDHYSLLRTIEDAWGMPRLNGAACACTPSLADFFTSVAASQP